MNEQPNQSIEERTEEYLANPAALQPAKALVRDLLAELQAARVNEGEAMLVVESAEYKLAAAESALHRLREVAARLTRNAEWPCMWCDETQEHDEDCEIGALRAELEGSAAATSSEQTEEEGGQ